MKITAIDSQSIDPESLAMLQAFYSRSHVSVGERLAELGDNAEQIKAALKKYYIGYGHASIGDCATVAVFIENVTLPAAKAVQDYALYNGQESSTRYIPFGDMTSDSDSERVRSQFYAMLNLYNSATSHAISHLTDLNTNAQGECAYAAGAIKARAFDITRGLLPSGVKTQLSWTTTLRKFYEHCKEMLSHPLEEVRDIAMQVNQQLHERYPSAMPLFDARQALDTETDNGRWFLQAKNNGALIDEGVYDLPMCTVHGKDTNSQSDSLVEVLNVVVPCSLTAGRTSTGAVDRIYDTVPQMLVSFDIDFGSYRDIQRHRNCFMRSSKPSLNHGMNGWYIKQLEAIDKTQGTSLVDDLFTLNENYWLIAARNVSEADLLNITPLLANVQVTMSLGLPQLVYLLELRSKLSVHPSLRTMIHKLYHVTKDRGLKEFFERVDLKIDWSEDGVFGKRAEQTITKDGEAI